MTAPRNDGTTICPASAVQPAGEPASRVRRDFDEAWEIYSRCVGDTYSPRENMDVVSTIYLGICQARIAEALDRIAAALEDDE